MLQVFFGIAMAAMGAGQNQSLAADQAKAKVAKEKIFSIMDTKSAVDAFSEAGLRPVERARGRIEFRDVSFAYPRRPTVFVLKVRCWRRRRRRWWWES
jgi:ATP-binding cassette subfamily B (MDR/TAP) protein 1